MRNAKRVWELLGLILNTKLLRFGSSKITLAVAHLARLGLCLTRHLTLWLNLVSLQRLASCTKYPPFFKSFVK